MTFVARGNRAAELRGRGAAIRAALTCRSDVAKLLVVDRLTPDTFADVCIVTVRREQMDDVQDNCSDTIARRVFKATVVLMSDDSRKLFELTSTTIAY